MSCEGFDFWAFAVSSFAEVQILAYLELGTGGRIVEEGVSEVKLSSLTESEFSVKSMYYLGSKEHTNMQKDNVECHQFVHMLFI